MLGHYLFVVSVAFCITRTLPIIIPCSPIELAWTDLTNAMNDAVANNLCLPNLQYYLITSSPNCNLDYDT